MPRLPLSTILTTTPHAPTWIIDDLIPTTTIVLVAGDAGVGKSMLNLCAGLHIATGRPFLGHRTTQTRVLYCDEENSLPDISAYLQRLWLGMDSPDGALLGESFRVEHFSLGGRDWPMRLGALARDWHPGIIYIDTATSALAIADENDNAEAQRAIQHLRHIMADCPTHPAIVVLKHAKYQNAGGKRGDAPARRTVRGAKAWLSAVDQTMYHIALGAGRPSGYRPTVLVPDKRRAFGLLAPIRITPVPHPTPPGIILHGEPLVDAPDLMMV